MGTSMNSTRGYLRAPAGGARQHAQILRPDALPRALFVADILALGFRHVARDEFEGSSRPELLERCGTPVLVRCDREADEVEAYLDVGVGAVAFVDGGYGHVRVEVAASTRAAATAAAARLRDQLKTDTLAREGISVAFWMRGQSGGDVRHREIDAPAFAAISSNYPVQVRSALNNLMITNAPDRGRLILWRGEPGTGKTHALRALARSWRSWCSAHFIMDPEELLGRGGAYLLDVLTLDDDVNAGQRWRLLILEDAGELIAAQAPTVTGQALSVLLNVADGLLGQGTRTLILITTNEPLRRIHSAARRAGRCLADIEFSAFPAAEANAWLAGQGIAKRVDRPTSLAELFGHASGNADLVADADSVGFGFARALSTVRDE